MISLTENQRSILSKVVADPDQWLADAVRFSGEAKALRDLTAKVSRWGRILTAKPHTARPQGTAK